MDQVTASQLCVTLPTESLDALMGVTDGLLLAVLGEGARCVQELDLEEERDLAGENPNPNPNPRSSSRSVVKSAS